MALALSLSTYQYQNVRNWSRFTEVQTFMQFYLIVEIFKLEFKKSHKSLDLYWLHLPLHFFRNDIIFENTFEIYTFSKNIENFVKFRKYIRKNVKKFRKYFRIYISKKVLW